MPQETASGICLAPLPPQIAAARGRKDTHTKEVTDMNISESLFKRPKLALVAAAVTVALAGSAQAQDRENANRSPDSESIEIARSDAGMQTLDQHLKSKTLRASKLIGMELQERSGDNVGDVRDIARGTAPGQEMQLIVALESAPGNDQKFVAIPFDDVQIRPDGEELYTNRTLEQLASMPTVMLDQPSDTPDRGAAREPGAGESRGAPGAGAGSGSASLGGRRIGDLVGAEVVGADSEQVGEVDDIVLSTAGADSVRAVLQVGGVAGIGEKRIALPLTQLAVERTGDAEPTVRVALDRDSLERMPEFEYEEDTATL
jgi:sporulation protein YlmC with PRC-barrel domain